jgi:hypothetical protein
VLGVLDGANLAADKTTHSVLWHSNGKQGMKKKASGRSISCR